MFGKFPYHIITFVERISQRSAIFPALVFQTVCSVTAKEPVWIEVCGRHTTQPETGSVDVVARNHGVDRADVELVRTAFAGCFHKVLNQGFCTEDDVFESRNLFETINEKVHSAFFFSQRHLAHACPVFVTFRKHIRLFYHLSFQSEESRLYRVELIIRIFRGTFYL